MVWEANSSSPCLLRENECPHKYELKITRANPRFLFMVQLFYFCNESLSYDSDPIPRRIYPLPQACR